MLLPEDVFLCICPEILSPDTVPIPLSCGISSMEGTYIFCPSVTLSTRLRYVSSASCANPPASSTTSNSLLSASQVYTPGFTIAPHTCTYILSLSPLLISAQTLLSSCLRLFLTALSSISIFIFCCNELSFCLLLFF